MSEVLNIIYTYLFITIFLLMFFIKNFRNVKIIESGNEVENEIIKYISILIICLFWIFMLPVIIINNKKNTSN